MRQVLLAAGVVLGCGFMLFPLYWMLVSSLRSEIYVYPIELVPARPGLAAYLTMFAEFPYFRWLFNTAYVAVASTAAVVLLGIPAAYGMARFEFRGRSVLELLILGSQMLPVSLLVIPVYVVWKDLGLLGSLNGLVLANMTVTLPIAIWMLRGFFESVPAEVEDAARVDGCNRLEVMWHVVIPLARSGVAATGMLCFLEAWTEYIYAITLVSSSDQMVVSGGLAREMFEQARIRWNLLMAGSVLATVPVALLLLPLQRYIVRGIATGAVKG